MYARRGSTPSLDKGTALTNATTSIHASTSGTDEEGENYLGSVQSIVTVLNNPAEYNYLKYLGIASDAWLLTPPALASGVLPDVKPEDFERFLEATARDYRRYESARHGEAEQKAAELLGGAAKPSQGEGLVQAMRHVPTMFFAEDFSMARAETWEQVCSTDSDEARAAALEELLQYLDVVETYLLREISSRSDHFLEAAAGVQDLRATLQRTYQQVQSLRSEVHDMDEGVCTAAIAIKALQRRRSNLEKVLSIAKVVETVVQGQMALQLMLPDCPGAAVDFGGALDVLDVLRSAVDSKELDGLHAFRHLPDELAQTSSLLDELMAREFLERTRLHNTQELMQQLEGWVHGEQGGQSVKEATAMFRVAADIEGSATWRENSDLLQGEVSLLHPALAGAQSQAEALDALLPILMGLSRSGRLSAVLVELQDEAAAQIRDIVRDILDRALAVTLGQAGNEATNGQENLQLLPDNTFLRVLLAVECAASMCLAHYGSIVAMIKDLLTLTRPSKQHAAAMSMRCNDVAQCVADAAQATWAKLITARAASTPCGTVDGLRSIVEVCNSFMAVVEGRGLRVGPGLRNAVQLHCRAVIEAFHDRTVKQLVTHMEQERWTAAAVPEDVQHIADSLLAQASALPFTSIDGVTVRGHKAANQSGHEANGAAMVGEAAGQHSSAPDGPAASHGDVDGHNRNGAIDDALTERRGSHKRTSSSTGFQSSSHSSSAATVPQGLCLDDTTYPIVHVACILVRMVKQYLEIQRVAPTCAPEVARKLMELLKVFNSRACQLVLGAGAMQCSGLKSITAKHLAMACQSLDAILHLLIPHLTTLFTLPVPQPRRALLLPEFERVHQDYKMHRDEILSKLVTIMRQRLEASLTQLPALVDHWSMQQGHAGAAAEVEPSQFAVLACKQLAVLRGVLHPLLQTSELHQVFGAVCGTYSSMLADAYSNLKKLNSHALAQCRADMQHFLDTFRALPVEPGRLESKLLRLMHVYYSFEARMRDNTIERPEAPGGFSDTYDHGSAVIANLLPKSGSGVAATLSRAGSGVSASLSRSGSGVATAGRHARKSSGHIAQDAQLMDTAMHIAGHYPLGHSSGANGRSVASGEALQNGHQRQQHPAVDAVEAPEATPAATPVVLVADDAADPVSTLGMQTADAGMAASGEVTGMRLRELLHQPVASAATRPNAVDALPVAQALQSSQQAAGSGAIVPDGWSKSGGADMRSSLAGHDVQTRRPAEGVLVMRQGDAMQLPADAEQDRFGTSGVVSAMAAEPNGKHDAEVEKVGSADGLQQEVGSQTHGNQEQQGQRQGDSAAETEALSAQTCEPSVAIADETAADVAVVAGSGEPLVVGPREDGADVQGVVLPGQPLLQNSMLLVRLTSQEGSAGQ